MIGIPIVCVVCQINHLFFDGANQALSVRVLLGHTLRHLADLATTSIYVSLAELARLGADAAAPTARQAISATTSAAEVADLQAQQAAYHPGIWGQPARIPLTSDT